MWQRRRATQTGLRNHLVMFKKIKVKIHANNHKKKIPKYLCCHLFLSICTFNMRYESQCQYEARSKTIKLRAHGDRLPLNKVQK